MANTYAHGVTASLDTVITNIMQDPVGTFMAALDPGLYPIRDVALANGLQDYEMGQKKIVWHEGALNASEITLDVAISADTTTTFDVTPIGAIRPNMLISFKQSEVVRVTSVDYDAGTFEATRGFRGSALASIETTDKGQILSTTPSETADAGNATGAYGPTLTNYVHYFEEVVRASDLSQGLSAKTPEGRISNQIISKMRAMSHHLARALYHSIAGSSGTSETYITMNGFRAQVPAAMITSSVGALVYDDIDSAVVSVMNNGVIPNTIYVGGNVKKGMASWDRSRMTYGTHEPGVVGGQVAKFQSAAGPMLDIEVDTSLPNNLTAGAELLICDRNNLRAGAVPLLSNNVEAYPGAPSQSGVRLERLARTGPVDTIQLLAYFTSQLLFPDGAALLTGITSVDADGVA